MELVYLWVEEYKNIKRQGFNFSPRFECEFKDEYEIDENGKEKLKDNCELIIKKKEHIEDFFGENINVTAIVGENGSGKSSIFECIEKIILADGSQQLDDFKYVLVYHDDHQLYLSNVKINTSIEQATVFSDVCSLMYKYNVSDVEINEARYYSSANLHYETPDKQGVINRLSAKQDDMNSFHISSFMYEPIKVEISLKAYNKLIQEYISMISFKKNDEIEKILKDITDLYHQYLSICYIRQRGLDVNPEILEDKEMLIKNTNNPLSQDDFNTYFISVATTKEFTLSEMSQEQKDIYFHKNYWHYFEFDFIDEKERRYNHLSHGEKVIFSQLLGVYFYMNNNEKFLFLFDEPEIALHPNWQKNYLNEVINLLQKIPKKHHFILTSHSPFILSDLPKENVIFLENGKQVEVAINPFGANIHTLLSHGFFMKDGLMGEFAKEKINSIIKNLSDKNYQIGLKGKKQLLFTIKSIGEEFLKSKLLDMYYKKFDDELTKKQRKEELQREQEKIKKELEQYD